MYVNPDHEPHNEGPMFAIHDITINGSFYDSGHGVEDAERNAYALSLEHPTRLVRVHDVDGIEVLSEFRNGERVES